MNPKIDTSYLNYIETTYKPLSFFGKWTDNISLYNKKFISNLPFEHVILDNFLEEKYSEQIYSLFPKEYKDWYIYSNPIEVKYAFDNINSLSEPLKRLFYLLSTKEMINIFSQLSSISDLQYDEYLHGAGLHSHPRYGRLDVHLDYEKHPLTGKERKLNVILYLNKEWKEEWNGKTELWNESNCEKEIDIVFNRAILFKTNDISWHGVSKTIMCPDDVYRKSLAYYYVGNLNNQKEKYREKADFKYNGQDENIRQLYNIRKERRITEEDMKKYAPTWSSSEKNLT